MFFWGGPKCWPNGAKSDPKLGFSPLSQVWFISFPLNCIGNNFEQCLTTSRGKACENFCWGADIDQTGQNRAQSYVFCRFLKFGSFVILEIA